jgi:ribose transport system ATP-binding protein
VGRQLNGLAVEPPPIIAVRELSKTFGATTVLRSVDLSVRQGEIHGLIGHNGSGKSTLIKILSGYHSPDPGGELQVRGESVSLPLRHGDQRDLGIAFVHQDLGLVESLTVLENIRLGRYQHAGKVPRISWRAERRICEELLARFSISVSPDADLRDVQDVDRALIAIARAVSDIERIGRPGLLVLDEPTVYLPADSVQALFRTMRSVAGGGHGIIFVAHQLSEVLEISDEVTVLREGRVAGHLHTRDATHDSLVNLIVGRDLGDLYPAAAGMPDRRAVLAEVESLSGGMVRSFSATLLAGEIIGVTGLLGMGAEDVPYLLYGALPAAGGQLRWQGRSVSGKQLSPVRSLRSGVVLVPANRLRDGVVPSMSVGENVAEPILSRHKQRGRLRLGAIAAQVSRTLRAFDVRPDTPGAAMGTLSGGNQQKALIGKWLQVQPRLLLMHEPTQGVDIRARQEIFSYIAEAAAAGTTVLIASSEYEELVGLCHRVLVFRDGWVRSELSGSSLTEPELIKASHQVESSRSDHAPGSEGRAGL